jgi:CubicO group peptidase (beta-lactamase class C family)
MRRIARWTAIPVALTLAGALAGPVFASSRDVQTQVNVWSGPAPEFSAWCGFPIEETGRETIRITTSLDADGTPTGVFLQVVGRIVTTRVDTGATIVRTYARNVFDAFSGTPTFTGLALKVVAPGGGPIVDAGRIRVDFSDGSILLEAGHHPTFTEGGLDDCAALS